MISSPRNLALAIQAGGFSLRMGRDKALLPFGGQPLIQHIANRGKSLTNDVLVTTNQVEVYRFLGLPLYPDHLVERGALIGMHTALTAAKRPLVAVIGCDMPFFSPRLLACQARLLIKSRKEAVVPRSREGLEPLHGVYRREPCLRAVHEALELGIRSLGGWLKLLRALEIPEAQIRRLEPDSRIFLNVNTPEDYEQVKALADVSPPPGPRPHSEVSWWAGAA